jgi:hypothetical protein
MLLFSDLDLLAVENVLRKHLEHGSPWGYLRGKALMRDWLVHDLGCSTLEAETLIDTLETRGHLHFLGDATQPSHAMSCWELAPTPDVY